MNLEMVSYGPIQHEDITDYLGAAGDNNPIHRDKAAARTAGFDDVVLPGIFLLGLVEKTLEQWGVEDVAVMKSQFAAPAMIGSIISIEGRFISGGQVIRITVKHQNGQLLAVIGVEMTLKREAATK